MITIRSYEKIFNTPAMPLLARAWVEIGERFPAVFNGCPIGYDDNALVAFDGSEAIGVLSWNPQDWNQSAFIKVGWVVPEARRRGFYRMLWEALVKRATELKLRRIEGATPMDNAEMRAVAAKLGRYETYVTMAFDVPTAE